ncbi:tetratricopeptide repeat protein [Thalassobaculum sp.]|uniref:tetratricopeptide repeat protein n=1 Tax=Thalassobaculum sp. TaxID=2022740 RepID=UPI0032EF382F
MGNRMFGWITLAHLKRWRLNAKAKQDEAARIQTADLNGHPTLLPVQANDLAAVPVAGPPPRFRVLIARLHGDPDDRFREMITDAIERIGGVEAMTVAAEIALQEGVPPPERDRAAQDLLAEHRGDLLIAGRYLPEHNALRLRMINPGEGVSDVRGMMLDDPFELPVAFTEATVAALQAIALARISVTDEQAGSFLVDRLGPALERFRPLLENLGQRLSSTDSRRLHGAVTTAELRLGEQSGFDEPLHRAIRHCRKILADEDLQEHEAGWWWNALGNSLVILGGREVSNGSLYSAADAFRTALGVWSREHSTFCWATIQNNLGNALSELGEREGSNCLLVKAVEAYRDVLSEWTEDNFPLHFATVQSNLGNALCALGEREGSVEQLVGAVCANQAALERWSRERVPLQWAAAQANLGNALQALGELEGDVWRLAEAANAYRASLLEYTRERLPRQWATAQNNLGNALRILGERENSAARLTESVDACQNALLEHTRDRAPLDWAMTQNNLGAALSSLGKIEGSADRIGQAIDTFRSAQMESSLDRSPTQWAVAQTNLGNALRVLGELEGSADTLTEAVDTHRGAIAVFEGLRLSGYAEIARGNLRQTEVALVAVRGQ